MGLLSYYMIKNLGCKSEADFKKVARTVSHHCANINVPHSFAIKQEPTTCLIQPCVFQLTFNFLFLSGGVLDCTDDSDGRAVDPGNARCVGRQTP